jgi:hypothetical protein
MQRLDGAVRHGLGRMQSTGHTGTQLASLQQFWVMT